MSAILIRKARMVLPTVLGIDAEVGFFHSEPKEGPRYVELKATINGQPVEEKIPVTDMVSPGEIALLEWPLQDRLKIDLTKWGIKRFTEDQVFALTAVASSPASGSSRESTVEVRIPLPVIIVHGTIIKEWWDQDLYWKPYYSLHEFLAKNGYYIDDTSGYRSVWGPRDILFSPQDATSEDIVKQMDNWIDNALKNTYAAKVNIIGVSLGGLVGRYYITEYDASKVYKLIMVTVVNEGSSLFEGKYILGIPTRMTAEAILRNTEGKVNILNWLFPTYQSLYTSDGEEVPHPFKNLFHENGYDKPAPPGVHYYSVFSAERETPYRLVVEKKDNDWYKVTGDKQTGKGDGNSVVQSYKTFGHNIMVPTNTHHAFMLGDTKVQSIILKVLCCKPDEY